MKLAAAILILAGCSATPSAKPPAPLPSPLAVVMPPAKEITLPVAPGGDAGLRTPGQIRIEALRLEAQADDYVMDRHSVPAVNYRLGSMVARMKQAVGRMVLSRASGYSPAANVATARISVEDLREFLKAQR